MKNYDFLKYLIIGLIAYLIGMILENPFIPKQSDFSLNKIDKFQKTLLKKEQSIKQIIAQLKDSIKYERFIEYNNFIFLDADFNLLKENDFAIFIFRNDSLKFWSDNSIEIEDSYKRNNFEEKVRLFNNGWYVIVKDFIGNYNIVGLIKLKSKYPLSNKYLKNKFAKGFDLPENIKISSYIVSNSFKIKDSDGNTIMCLIPHGTVLTADSKISVIFYIIFMFFLSLSIYKFLKFLYPKNRLFYYLSIILFFIIRWLSIKYQFPQNLYSLKYFSSNVYASTLFFGNFRSLGDFLANILLIYAVFISLLDNFSLENKSKKTIYLNYFLSLLATGIIFIFNNYLFSTIILNSQIYLKLYNIVEFDFLSFLALFNVLITVLLFTFSMYKLFSKISQLSVKEHILISFATSVLLFLISVALKNILPNSKHYYVLYFFLLTILMTFFVKTRKLSMLYFYIGFTVWAAFYITNIFIVNQQKKIFEEANSLINRLVNERDDIAELLFLDISPKLSVDENVSYYLKKYNPEKAKEKITQYLESRYFKGYWKKYNINAFVCKNSDTILKQNKCLQKFGNIIKYYGTQVDTLKDTYFIRDPQDNKFYLLAKRYDVDTQRVFFLFVQLSPKLYPQNIGYPELLLDDKIQIKQFPKEYSYAKYVDNKLTYKSGDYPYSIDGTKFLKLAKNKNYFSLNGYNHVLLKIQDNSFYVLSYKKITFFQLLISFSYIFLMFNFGLLLILLFYNFKRVRSFQLNFRIKFILAIFSILTISFILVGIITFAFNLKQFNQQHYEDIKEKLNSIATDLKFIYQRRDTLQYNWQPQKSNALSYRIHHLSEVFNNDINLYNSRADLIATSREEIFIKRIIGTKINFQALYNILIEKNQQFVHNEEIGDLKFLSAYAPLINRDNKILGIINLPYFANTEQFHERQTNLLVTLLNIYVVLFTLSIFIAVFFAEQIIAPLNILVNKFEKLEVGKRYEKIDYKKNDEIGELVKAYNEMVEKLEESIKLLAQSERESAWREMARQIAHEIKNPLTPMKLSIQLLLRAWENQDQDFDRRLKKISQTLIEQIETLKNIAEQFGEFAKNPKPNKQVINLAEKMKSILNLYQNIENVEVVDKILDDDVYILADEKFISRIYINLIKNSIQAMDESRKGYIEVGLKKTQKNTVLTWVKDNGIGIPDSIKDKLFTPKFTTKSSGMGIGLNMVKNMVESSDGKIWFESEVGKGTTFYVEFPLIKTQENE